MYAERERRQYSYSSCISQCEVFLEEKPEYYSAKMY